MYNKYLNNMLGDIVFYVLSMRVFLMNMICCITDKIYATRNIYIVKDKQVKSVYLRYVLLLILSYFQWCMFEMVYVTICSSIDVDAHVVHIERVINGITRSIIYENGSHYCNAIQNAIGHVYHYECDVNTNNPFPYILMNCVIKSNDTTHELDVKSIIKKYIIDRREQTNLGNILTFNKIDYALADKFRIKATVNRKFVTKEVILLQVLDCPIYDLLESMLTT